MLSTLRVQSENKVDFEPKMSCATFSTQVRKAPCKVHGFGYPTSRDFYSFDRLLKGRKDQGNTASYRLAEFFSPLLQGN